MRVYLYFYEHVFWRWTAPIFFTSVLVQYCFSAVVGLSWAAVLLSALCVRDEYSVGSHHCPLNLVVTREHAIRDETGDEIATIRALVLIDSGGALRDHKRGSLENKLTDPVHYCIHLGSSDISHQKTIIFADYVDQ